MARRKAPRLGDTHNSSVVSKRPRQIKIYLKTIKRFDYPIIETFNFSIGSRKLIHSRYIFNNWLSSLYNFYNTEPAIALAFLQSREKFANL